MPTCFEKKEIFFSVSYAKDTDFIAKQIAIQKRLGDKGVNFKK